MPATAIARIPASFLEQERRALPQRIYAAEYCCQFTEAADAVFAYDDVQAALTPGLVGVRLFADEECHAAKLHARPRFGPDS